MNSHEREYPPKTVEKCGIVMLELSKLSRQFKIKHKGGFWKQLVDLQTSRITSSVKRLNSVNLLFTVRMKRVVNSIVLFNNTVTFQFYCGGYRN